MIVLDESSETLLVCEADEKPSDLRFGISTIQAKTLDTSLVAELKKLIVKSVIKRVESIPFSIKEQNDAVAVMFSGGLDSTLLATILAASLEPSLTIDLINVSFQAESSADRITSIFSYNELLRLFPAR